MILVTGAHGFLGRALVSSLTKAGREVRSVVRRGGSNEISIGSISPETDWTAALTGIDAVVHCAAISPKTAGPGELTAINTVATLGLARQASAAGVRRFVFISSIGVNGSQTKDSPFRHDDEPQPRSPYAVSKYEAEIGLRKIARATGMEAVIVRPPLIFGREPSGNLGVLTSAIKRGLPIPLGGATRNRRDLVSLENLCRLITVAIDHKSAAGQTFLASDGRPVSTRGLVERLAQQAGRHPFLVSTPPWITISTLRALGKGAMASQLFGDLEVDIAHTRETLSWSPI